VRTSGGIGQRHLNKLVVLGIVVLLGACATETTTSYVTPPPVPSSVAAAERANCKLAVTNLELAYAEYTAGDTLGSRRDVNQAEQAVYQQCGSGA
jgi:hypothetical protein